MSARRRPDGTARRSKQFRLPDDLIIRFEQEADRRGVSDAVLAERALLAFLNAAAPTTPQGTP